MLAVRGTHAFETRFFPRIHSRVCFHSVASVANGHFKVRTAFFVASLARLQLLFQSIADTKNWSYGLEVAVEAFQMLPMQFSNALWPNRVLFMSRLGQVGHAGTPRVTVLILLRPPSLSVCITIATRSVWFRSVCFLLFEFA